MRTMALYFVPKEGEQATRFEEGTYDSVAKARKARRVVCGYGTEVAIHVGEEHPDPLPFGEILWKEIPAKPNPRRYSK